ncbi:F1F0 ATP synthase subunit e, mitochondrial [Malassezia pachydermatis]|uniref:ATP synthase F(0) complex subunit e, mitochondrial n=1 Tax=Malassezia pachydermatis TaxID=77020 RepID=A0A0N0RSE5_9BASI|nr:tim11-subunit e of the dimeric form of mitochondrial f1f0-atpase [Malassezia pachydermatis]KOS14922.1 tim11-subunit e of the dimeric form of mitochondrial f1f0-atpase [Malassezia pachydermatis]
MSPSPIVNVVRYSALVAGIGYGIVHRRTLQTQYDEKIQQKAVKHQEDLIKQAKEKYAALQQAKKPILKSDDVVFNPDDPNFDIEKVIAYLEKL